MALALHPSAGETAQRILENLSKRKAQRSASGSTDVAEFPATPARPPALPPETRSLRSPPIHRRLGSEAGRREPGAGAANALTPMAGEVDRAQVGALLKEVRGERLAA
jgi:hypothetical protein